MKYLKGLYVSVVLMVIVTMTSEFILDGDYSAIASWIILMLFLLSSIFFANARYYLSEK